MAVRHWPRRRRIEYHATSIGMTKTWARATATPAKPILDDNPVMSDTTPPGHAKVHVVKPAPPRGEPEPGVEPLRIAYSSTRVMPEALAHLQRQHGIVRADRSALAESFRMLRNQVLQRMRAEGHRLLAVTSARRIEGKSLTAVNLALTLAADFDTAVLIVDADLGGAGVQSLFGLTGARGLSDHLLRGVPIAELLVNPGVDRLVLLPAGQEAVLESSELLATKATRLLVAEMKQRYQDRYIIVDLPPILETADALAFLPQVDTTLVVAEEGTTSLPDLERVNELLAPFDLIGTVMSQRREPADADSGGRAPWYRRWSARRS
jgi:Mrp family chromosome partitioning ATPase